MWKEFSFLVGSINIQGSINRVGTDKIKDFSRLIEDFPFWLKICFHRQKCIYRGNVIHWIANFK